jgi:hypothetical protein
VFYFLWPALTYKGTTHGLWSGLGGYVFACLVFYFLWPALTYKGTTHGLWSGLGGYVFACLVLSFFWRYTGIGKVMIATAYTRWRGLMTTTSIPHDNYHRKALAQRAATRNTVLIQ